MYLASNSETRPPYRSKNQGVMNGKAAKTTMLSTMKMTVLTVNGAKMSPRPINVRL